MHFSPGIPRRTVERDDLRIAKISCCIKSVIIPADEPERAILRHLLHGIQRILSGEAKGRRDFICGENAVDDRRLFQARHLQGTARFPPVKAALNSGVIFGQNFDRSRFIPGNLSPQHLLFTPALPEPVAGKFGWSSPASAPPELRIEHLPRRTFFTGHTEQIMIAEGKNVVAHGVNSRGRERAAPPAGFRQPRRRQWIGFVLQWLLRREPTADSQYRSCM